MRYRKIDYVMMKTAMNFSTLSSAERKKVGAVLSRNGRILACGYNGTLPGKSNICEIDCEECNGRGYIGVTKTNMAKSCDRCGGFGKVTSEFVLHAEQNILTFCNREGLATNDCDIYVTMAPCKTCSKLIASAGIKKVFYHETYRDLSGIEFLDKLGITVIKLEN